MVGMKVYRVQLHNGNKEFLVSEETANQLLQHGLIRQLEYIGPVIKANQIDGNLTDKENDQ